MKIDELMTPQSVLKELAKRVSEKRLQLNFTQKDFAEKCGLSKRTVERFENGESVQLESFIKILRALNYLNKLDLIIPQEPVHPMALIKTDYNDVLRKRASKSSLKLAEKTDFKWGEDK